MYDIILLNDYIGNGFIIELVDIIYLISITLGIATIWAKNPVYAVLFLIGLFVNIASLLILIGYSFMGLSYILVYVGAVSILFLFILMLINIRVSELINETSNNYPLGFLTAGLFYSIVNQVLPSNLTDNTIITKLSDRFSNEKIILIDNESFSLEDLKQGIGYASSKAWDSSLIEPTHITSIGNIMYTSYSIWLLISSIILLLGMVGAILITIKQK